MSHVTQLEAEARFPTYTAGGVKDNLAWAKRFQYRHEHGDKDVKPHQIKAALAAIANHEGEKEK